MPQPDRVLFAEAVSRLAAYSLIVSSSRYRDSPRSSWSNVTSDLSISAAIRSSTAVAGICSSAQTCSAISRFHPANTDSRRSRICSGPDSSS